MHVKSAADPEKAAATPAWRSDKFAKLVADDREQLMTTFAASFDRTFGASAGIRAEAMAIAASALDDVVRSVRAGELRLDADMGAWALDLAGRDAFLGPADSVSATLLFVDLAFSLFAGYLAADPDQLPCFRIAVQAMNESVRRLMQVIVAVCAAWQTQSLQQAQADERRRLARELHDRVGESLSVGLRRLDLHEMDGPGQAQDEDYVAREVLVTAMSRLRTVTSELREPPLTSIRRALDAYLSGLPADVEVGFQLSGDEHRVPPVVHDEVFLIIREAVRNALTHGAPQRVEVTVQITGTELRVRVTDDGHGFETARVVARAFLGIGIPSMRERAALLGGRCRISSRPGEGTRVEVEIPLTDQLPLLRS